MDYVVPHVQKPGRDKLEIDGVMTIVETIITPLEPRGCRYLEVHAVCDDANQDVDAIKLVQVKVLYRCYEAYHAEPTGAFQATGSPSLDVIWRTGVESTRSVVARHRPMAPTHGVL